jgi:hypothetical protein
VANSTVIDYREGNENYRGLFSELSSIGSSQTELRRLPTRLTIWRVMNRQTRRCTTSSKMNGGAVNGLINPMYQIPITPRSPSAQIFGAGMQRVATKQIAIWILVASGGELDCFIRLYTFPCCLSRHSRLSVRVLDTLAVRSPLTSFDGRHDTRESRHGDKCA